MAFLCLMSSYAECHLCLVSHINKLFMLSVVILSGVMLGVVAPSNQRRYLFSSRPRSRIDLTRRDDKNVPTLKNVFSASLTKSKLGCLVLPSIFCLVYFYIIIRMQKLTRAEHLKVGIMTLNIKLDTWLQF
jgi:hypothetical protein